MGIWRSYKIVRNIIGERDLIKSTYLPSSVYNLCFYGIRRRFKAFPVGFTFSVFLSIGAWATCAKTNVIEQNWLMWSNLTNSALALSFGRSIQKHSNRWLLAFLSKQLSPLIFRRSIDISFSSGSSITVYLQKPNNVQFLVESKQNNHFGVALILTSCLFVLKHFSTSWVLIAFEELWWDHLSRFQAQLLDRVWYMWYCGLSPSHRA